MRVEFSGVWRPKHEGNAKNSYKIEGLRSPLLDQAVAEIVETGKRTGAKVSGPIPLPVKREIYTVNRSPVIDKKSREQFYLITHKRLMELNEPTAKTIDALRKLNLPAGVDVEIK